MSGTKIDRITLFGVTEIIDQTLDRRGVIDAIAGNSILIGITLYNHIDRNCGIGPVSNDKRGKNERGQQQAKIEGAGLDKELI